MIGWIYISFCVCFFFIFTTPCRDEKDGRKAKSNADRMWQPTGHFLLSQLKFSVSWQIGGWTQMAFLSALNCWRHTSSMESSLPKQTSSEPSGEKLFLVCHFCLPLKTLESSPQGTWHMEKRGLCTLPHAQISVLVISNLYFLPVSAPKPLCSCSFVTYFSVTVIVTVDATVTTVIERLYTMLIHINIPIKLNWNQTNISVLLDTRKYIKNT